MQKVFIFKDWEWNDQKNTIFLESGKWYYEIHLFKISATSSMGTIAFP